MEHERLRTFLEKVQDSKFERYASNKSWAFRDIIPASFSPLYEPHELDALRSVEGTIRKIEKRMPIKTTLWYGKMAAKSVPLQQLIMPSSEEINDLTGHPLPVDQAAYSPLPGISHVYPDIVRLNVVATCSAHCRFCYQQTLLSSPRDGTANPDIAAAYIRHHNDKAYDMASRPFAPLREALLSGGDPMVLPNTLLFKYMAVIVEAGITTVRIATKELAFFPFRFNTLFFNALDSFHATYPDVSIKFMLHFSHPDEFLERPLLENSVKSAQPWIPEVASVVHEFHTRRNFIRLYNQTPIIRGVNDDSNALAQMQFEMTRHEICNYYFFQCREIIGHKRFAVNLERSRKIVDLAETTLSQNSPRARLAMSTRVGKLEIVAAGGNEVVFRVIRVPRHSKIPLGTTIIARSNPEALWISDYLDRIVSDEAGVLRGYDFTSEL
jgi:lysine 2,3-aminomutase